LNLFSEHVKIHFYKLTGLLPFIYLYLAVINLISELSLKFCSKSVIFWFVIKTLFVWLYSLLHGLWTLICNFASWSLTTIIFYQDAYFKPPCCFFTPVSFPMASTAIIPHFSYWFMPPTISLSPGCLAWMWNTTRWVVLIFLNFYSIFSSIFSIYIICIRALPLIWNRALPLIWNRALHPFWF